MEAGRLTGNVDLKAGSNVTITQSGQTIEVASTGAAGSSVYGELYTYDMASAEALTSTYKVIVVMSGEGISSGTTVDTAQNRITVLSDGIYYINAAVSFSGNNSTEYLGAIFKKLDNQAEK